MNFLDVQFLVEQSISKPEENMHCMRHSYYAKKCSQTKQSPAKSKKPLIQNYKMSANYEDDTVSLLSFNSDISFESNLSLDSRKKVDRGVNFRSNVTRRKMRPSQTNMSTNDIAEFSKHKHRRRSLDREKLRGIVLY